MGKARVVLNPADALFRNRKEDFTIPGDTGGGIVHLGVVKPDCNHCVLALDFSPQHHVMGVCSPVTRLMDPPARATVSRTDSTLSDAPRQLFPAISGESPNNEARAWLIFLNPRAHGKSTTRHASR